jgi:hypothetical protein
MYVYFPALKHAKNEALLCDSRAIFMGQNNKRSRPAQLFDFAAVDTIHSKCEKTSKKKKEDLI